MATMKIKKDDMVQVIAGKDKGKKVRYYLLMLRTTRFLLRA